LSDTTSVYIHVPFCLKKCSYCDFYSTDSLSFLPAYVQSLQREIEIRAKQAQKARTIYFGGGTPSLLPLADVEKILKTIYTCYRVSKNAEITFEVNPGTVDNLYLSGLKKLGVNRLSIGVQSFDSDKIKVLGRIHSVEESIGTIMAAKAAGFENIGLDLIYGTPGETLEKWIRDLKMALEFNVAHLSCYMLTLEPGTPLHLQYEKGLFPSPDTDILTDFFMATATFLEKHGYEHYEISNFALGKKNRSRHNSNYWQMTPYEGFGPSAHSFGIDHIGSEKQEVSPVRFWNLADVKAYISSLGARKLPVQEKEVLSCRQQALERVMLGLRTREGLDLIAVENMMGKDFLKAISLLVDSLEARKLGSVVTGPGKRFKLTLEGWVRLDNIVEAFAEKII
jgi:oxygen-independent coproporphyrinogen-3 oxidase